MKALDPALKRVDDPLKPANVAVHAIRHAEPLFASRKSGLAWADTVECLLDLHETCLEAQVNQFLEEMADKRQTRNEHMAVNFQLYTGQYP